MENTKRPAEAQNQQPQNSEAPISDAALEEVNAGIIPPLPKPPEESDQTF